jgi:iron-sulfur cluster assembly protein
MFEINPEVRLTEEAAAAVKESFREGGFSTADTRLRIGANYGGCAGWRWEMETEEFNDVSETDQVFDSNGISIIINKEILYNIIGDLVISYRKINLVEQGFLFVRDNGHACGCGESFSSVVEDYKIEKV